MTPIRSVLSKVTGKHSEQDNAILALGLPLEFGNRTIYPVFLDPLSTDDDVEPHQIGYLDIGDNRSDYISLEPDYRPIVVLPFILIVIGLAIWLLRRKR